MGNSSKQNSVDTSQPTETDLFVYLHIYFYPKVSQSVKG